MLTLTRADARPKNGLHCKDVLMNMCMTDLGRTWVSHPTRCRTGVNTPCSHKDKTDVRLARGKPRAAYFYPPYRRQTDQNLS
ncbi:protein of unknown function [Serratia sp. Tan611]|nr:protein of unknown function [Serratia sp. Tan611]